MLLCWLRRGSLASCEVLTWLWWDQDITTTCRLPGIAQSARGGDSLHTMTQKLLFSYVCRCAFPLPLLCRSRLAVKVAKQKQLRSRTTSLRASLSSLLCLHPLDELHVGPEAAPPPAPAHTAADHCCLDRQRVGVPLEPRLAANQADPVYKDQDDRCLLGQRRGRGRADGKRRDTDDSAQTPSLSNPADGTQQSV